MGSWTRFVSSAICSSFANGLHASSCSRKMSTCPPTCSRTHANERLRRFNMSAKEQAAGTSIFVSWLSRPVGVTIAMTVATATTIDMYIKIA